MILVLTSYCCLDNTLKCETDLCSTKLLDDELFHVSKSQLHCYRLPKTHTFCSTICHCVVTDRSTGRVGAPLTCNEVMLVDWNEGKSHRVMISLVVTDTVTLRASYASRRYTMAHEAVTSQGILLSTPMAHKGMMWLASHRATFDSLLCRYPSRLAWLVAHQKLQAQTWIPTGDLPACSLVPWPLDYCGTCMHQVYLFCPNFNNDVYLFQSCESCTKDTNNKLPHRTALYRPTIESKEPLSCKQDTTKHKMQGSAWAIIYTEIATHSRW